MNNIVIDTNPIVYIYNGVPGFGEQYAVLLDKLSRKYNLVIPKIVYGELSLMFNSGMDINAFLSDTDIEIQDIPRRCYIEAAERWQKYNQRRILMCHECGEKIRDLSCKKCGKAIKIRQHILSDFLIGAFAHVMKRKTIVTSDKGYYKTYFPELKIVSL